MRGRDLVRHLCRVEPAAVRHREAVGRLVVDQIATGDRDLGAHGYRSVARDPADPAASSKVHEHEISAVGQSRQSSRSTGELQGLWSA